MSTTINLAFFQTSWFWLICFVMALFLQMVLIASLGHICGSRQSCSKQPEMIITFVESLPITGNTSVSESQHTAPITKESNSYVNKISTVYEPEKLVMFNAECWRSINSSFDFLSKFASIKISDLHQPIDAKKTITSTQELKKLPSSKAAKPKISEKSSMIRSSKMMPVNDSLALKPKLNTEPASNIEKPNLKTTPYDNLFEKDSADQVTPDNNFVTFSNKLENNNHGAVPDLKNTANILHESSSANPTINAKANSRAKNIKNYLAYVRREIERNKRYPAKARRQGIEGCVGVVFSIDSHGNICSEAAESSSDEALSEAALALLKGLHLSILPPPEWNPNARVRMTIRYSLH